MTRRASFLVVLLPLAACVEPEPSLFAPDVLAQATEPLFQLRTDGRIAATSCLSGRPSSYGRAPAACVVDSALAAQVLNPGDLVAPRQPGPPYAAPVADAAYDYLFGEGASGRASILLGGRADGAGGARVDITAEGAGALQGAEAAETAEGVEVVEGAEAVEGAAAVVATTPTGAEPL